MSNSNTTSRYSQKGKVVKMRPRAETQPSKKKAAKPAKINAAEKKSSAPEGKAENQPKQLNLNLKQSIMEMTMSKQNKAFDQLTKDAGEITRDYSDALMKSGTILMKGCENMMSVVMSMVQSSAEKQARLMKEAMSSKTINEFAEIQNKIAQTSFDDFMSGATKISEISVKLMTESSEPVNSQMTKAIQRATESMAA